VRARRHLSARALAASLRCCRGLAASLPPRCLAASLTPPYLARVRTRRTPPVDAHAAPSARRRAAIVAVAPKPPSRALPSRGPRPDFITERCRRHQPARCALTRLQGRLASTPPPGRAHAAAALLLRPPLPAELSLPLCFAQGRSTLTLRSPSLPKPSQAAPKPERAAAPPLPPPLELTVEPLPLVPVGPN